MFEFLVSRNPVTDFGFRVITIRAVGTVSRVVLSYSFAVVHASKHLEDREKRLLEANRKRMLAIRPVHAR